MFLTHLQRTRVLDAAVHHWLTEPALKACRHTRQPRFADGRNPTERPHARACLSGPGSLSQSGVAFCQGLEESLEPDRVTGTGRKRSPLGLPAGATQARLCYGSCIRQTTPGSRRGPNRLVLPTVRTCKTHDQPESPGTLPGPAGTPCPLQPA